MADQNTVLQMVADPEFGKLTPADKRTALSAHDPEFGKLDDAGIQQFVSAHTSSPPNAGLSTGNALPKVNDTTTSISSRKPNWFEDAGNDLRYGSGNTFLGRMYKKIGGQPLSSGVPPAITEAVGGPLLGPLKVGEGITTPPQKDDGPINVRAFNKIVRGVGQTVGLPLAATQPEFLALAAPTAVAQYGAEKGLTAAGVEPENAEAVTNAALLGLGARKLTKATADVPSARSATPEQTENLNALRATNNRHVNYDASDAVAPEIRNAAAQMAQEQSPPSQASIPSIIGKAASKRPQLRFGGKNVKERVASARQLTEASQRAVNEHEAQVTQVTTPYQDHVVSLSSAADAVRASITPELQAAATSNPEAAATVTRLNALADELNGNARLSDVSAKRQRFNDELATEYDKADAKQAESPVVTQAKKDAANALREIQYGTLSDLTGTDIRPLMKREGQLIEYKADVNRKLASAANSPENVVAPYGKRLKNAVTRFGVGPKSTHSTFDVVKTTFGARPTTPIEEFNAMAERGLSNLGQPTPPSPINIPSPIARAIDFEGARQGEPEIVRPGNFANAGMRGEISLARGGGVIRRKPLLLEGAVTQPSGRATPEFAYRNGPTRGDVLPAQQGRRVPPQLANVAIRGELPQRSGATPLPSASDTSIIGNRQIEVPRSRTSPEDAVPQIVRQFAETHPFTGPRIDVIHPDGKTLGSIPVSQLEEALRNNYRLANPLK